MSKPTKVVESPSGKYKLSVSTIETRPGCWNYTNGVVTRDGETIVEVKRNYSSFPFLFIEGHPNGHDYLVCGADYQGQTVVELDTGVRRDFLPEEAKKGHGFCWVSYTYEPEHQMLVVAGCVWAGPYEHRFYDFSDPMGQGWPRIGDEYIDADDGKDPTFHEDGTFTCYETREEEDGEENEEGELPRSVIATKRFRREGLNLVLVESWIDPEEQKRRDQWEEDNRRHQAQWDEYKRTDEVYLHVVKRVSEALFSAESYYSVGFCYQGWGDGYPGADTFTASESHINRRIVKDGLAPDGTKITIDLEWGKKTAPVKLIVFRNGKTAETLWFDRSIAGIDSALDQALAILGGA